MHIMSTARTAKCDCLKAFQPFYAVQPGRKQSRVQRRPSYCRSKEATNEAAERLPDDVPSPVPSPEPTSVPSSSSNSSSKKSPDKRVSNFVKNTATTFAPRPSTATRNPAYKGSLLYQIFGAQAWLSILIGGLLSFNLLLPTEQPSIARLMGMWSIWVFTIPALRARECTAQEKEALNILFLAVPLLNVGLPFVWKSFPFIFSADVVALGAVYAWKLGPPSLSAEK